MWVLSFGLFAVSATAQRLHIVNGCSTEPMWIASHTGSTKLNPGQKHDFHIDGQKGLRFWPKMGCDASGQRCQIGDSGGPGQTCASGGCAPPVDTKFEITVDNNLDWWDSSAVDGYTLPFKLELSSDCTASDIDCSGLTLDTCPAEDIQSVGHRDLHVMHNGEIAGCYSPCGLLTFSNWGNPDGHHNPGDSTAGPYCCPSPKWTPQSCRAGPCATMHYTEYIHSKCQIYAYSYDDAVGLRTCPPTTHYTWTLFCPSTPPTPSPPQSCDAQWGSCQPDPESGSCRDHLEFAISKEGKSCTDALSEVRGQCEACSACGVSDCNTPPTPPPAPSCDAQWGSCQPDPESGSCRDHLEFAMTKEGKRCTEALDELLGQCEACSGCSVVDCAPTPSPPSPGPWQPCHHGHCCNPYSEVKQYCPGGLACQECGGGDACQCPSQYGVVV